MSNELATRPSAGLATLGSGPSVLGESQARIPIGGRIRAGIMVLKSEAAKNPAAAEIYRRGVEAGASWDAIEAKIKRECGFSKASLVPKNTEYFGCKRADFTVRETADRIIELYGEDREDGNGRQVYRFPVMFALDNWQANMPHGLKEFTASELRYWSEYAPDGTRYCMTREAAQIDQRSRRAKRTFGGRRTTIVAQCEPNDCSRYQCGACGLRGSLVFFIPGIAGSSAIAHPTTSFYAMNQWRQQMELVSFVRGGRISGLHEGKPIFWLTKRLDSISRIDPQTGKPKRQKTWIVHLEADVPMDRVFAETARDDAMLAGSQAVVALEGSATPGSRSATGEPPDKPQGPPPETGIQRISELLQSIDLDAEAHHQHASREWGQHWYYDENSVEAVIRELEAAIAGDTEGFIDRVVNPVPF